MAARFSGTWREGGDGSAGIADIQGNFSRASIGAIERYLPKFLNQDAHDWMSKGLVAGTIRDARVLLRGDLDYFPFEAHPDKGEFHAQGSYSDRKSVLEGQSVTVRVDLGGRRILQKINAITTVLSHIH